MSLIVAISELYNDQELLAKAEHWERVELDCVVKILNGFPLKSAGFTSKPDGFPVIRIRDLKYNSVQTYYTLDFPEEFIVGNCDLLIGMDGDFICYEWSAGKAVLNQRVCKLIPDERYLLKRFLFYGINGYLKAIWNATSAVTVKHLSSLDIAKIPFPLPPLAEQARIVKALDGLLGRVRSAQEQLATVPKLLKRFRQGVLSAAVSGKLTEDWREENEWEETTASEIASKIQIGPFGSQLHQEDYVLNGTPVINPTHIKNGQILPDWELTISQEKFESLPNYHLRKGDVIIGRRGEMGRCALVMEEENGWFCGTGSLFIRADETKMTSEFLFWVLSSPVTKEFLDDQAKGSTMSNLNRAIIRSIPLPLPPLAEQQEIVRRVSGLLDWADKLEAGYKAAKRQLDAMPAAILAKAFAGELTEQDPADEPATVLLERIRAERSAEQQRSKEKKILTIDGVYKAPKRRKTMAEQLRSIKEILTATNAPVSTHTVWQQSVHKDDIEAFYADLKQLVDVDGSVVDVKEGEQSYLKLADAD